MHELIIRQTLPISIEEAWTFFSKPQNLNEITPPDMNFRILSSYLPDKTYAGMIIRYTVSPLLGIPMNWVTLITHSVDNEMFIDTQISGPYRIWHHQHLFRQVDGGVEMTDILHYQLYGGIFGRWLNALFVGRKVKQIFEFRRKKLIQLFGATNK